MIVKIVNGDVWKALYIDDELIYENHDIEIPDFLEYIKENNENELISDIEYSEHWCDPEWLEDVGGFPQNFYDIRFEE